MRIKLQLGALAATTLIAAGCSNTRSLDDVRATLAKNLPTGTRKDEVVRYLNTNRIAHSDCAPDRGNCVLARISGGNHQLNIVRTDYGVMFQFDQKDQLVETDINPHYTGP